LKGAKYQKKSTEEATVVVVNFNNSLRRSRWTQCLCCHVQRCTRASTEEPSSYASCTTGNWVESAALEQERGWNEHSHNLPWLTTADVPIRSYLPTWNESV